MSAAIVDPWKETDPAVAGTKNFAFVIASEPHPGVSVPDSSTETTGTSASLAGGANLRRKLASVAGI
jgi:hypothetical protein